SSCEIGAPTLVSKSSTGSCQTAMRTPEDTRMSTTLGSAGLDTAMWHSGQRKLYEPRRSSAHTCTDTSSTVRSTSPQLGQLARIVVTTILLPISACARGIGCPVAGLEHGVSGLRVAVGPTDTEPWASNRRPSTSTGS